MTTKWIEIKIDIPSENAEDVSVHLIDLGSNGVITQDKESDKTSLTACFPSEEALYKTAEIKNHLDNLGLKYDITSKDLKDTDWETNWKKFFKPEKVTDRIVVKPTWEDYESKGSEIVIEIDPKMAFGTGTHQTTKGCLKLIEEAVSRGNILSMLDVGTGSGILAIAAAKLGIPKTIAIDTDKEALKVANENISLNKVENYVRTAAITIDRIAVRFNLAAANITADEIVKLSSYLKDRIDKGDYLILSGILTSQKEAIRDSFKDLALEKELIDGEWVSLLYKKTD